MNYAKIYAQLIERSTTRSLDGYTEKHHVVPRCMGGDDSVENIAILTPEEHFVAHILLVKIHKNTKHAPALIKGVVMMTSGHKGKRSRKIYGWLRRAYAKSMSGDNNPNRKYPEIAKSAALKRVGSRRTAETRKRMSDAQKGRTFTSETKRKMSIAAKNKPKISEETRKKLSESAKGRKGPWAGKTRDDSFKQKISMANKGRSHSKEFCDNAREHALIREGIKREFCEQNSHLNLLKRPGGVFIDEFTRRKYEEWKIVHESV